MDGGSRQAPERAAKPQGKLCSFFGRVWDYIREPLRVMALLHPHYKEWLKQ
jgi:hypothetical protein